MGQSLAQLYAHIIFSTKGRAPYLKDKSVRSAMFAELSDACRIRKCPAMAVGGVEDHVHLLCRMDKSTTIIALIRDIKRQTSKWIKEQYPRLRAFHWQEGYGAFSISPAHIAALTEYIAKQEEHHRDMSYQDEYRRICGKYGAELDERYAWD